LAIDTGSLADATDEALVVAFQDGDPDAFSQIVETYYGVLFARARRQLRSNDDAQDAVQETLLRAYRSLPSFAGDYRLAAWLNRILGNVVADSKRRHGVQIRLHARLAGVRDTDPLLEELVADGTDDVGVRATVEGAIASLSSAHRQAFMLRAVEDQSYAEIAEILDISEVNARARVHRARTNLQRTLRSTTGSLGVVLVSWRGHVTRLFGHQVSRSNTTLSRTRPFVIPGTRSSSGLGVSQAVTQTLGSSTGQALTTIASEAGRWALPTNAAFASVLASAAAVVAPATVLLAPMAAPPVQAAPAAHVIAATPRSEEALQTTLLNQGIAPSSGTTTSTTTSTTLPVSSSPSTTSISANTPVPEKGTAKAAPTSPTAWVNAGLAAPTTSSATTGAAAPACPYLQSFPNATTSGVSLPPAETSGPGAQGYLSTSTVSLPSIGSSFDVMSEGTISDGSQSGVANVLLGACLPSTSTPAMVANVTNNDGYGSGELQLRGALVSSSTASGETDTYYRGMAMWLSGPDEGDPSVLFVADVVTQVPDNTVMMHVAFFGPVNQLVPSGAQTCAATPDSGSNGATGASSTTGTGTDSTSTTSQGSTTPSTNPVTSGGCGTTGEPSDSSSASASQSSTTG
jgi:RNA polymerase sigma factor (sigma-70 family)